MADEATDENRARFADRALDGAQRMAMAPLWQERNSPYRHAVVTEMLVQLHDGLRALNSLGRRVDFREDIEGGADVSDMVAQMRNAACHVGSLNRVVANGNSVVGIMVGAGSLAQIGDIELRSDYPDDIAFFFGRNRLYLVRHIRRAINVGRETVHSLAVEREWLGWFGGRMVRPPAGGTASP